MTQLVDKLLYRHNNTDASIYLVPVSPIFDIVQCIVEDSTFVAFNAYTVVVLLLENNFQKPVIAIYLTACICSEAVGLLKLDNIIFHTHRSISFLKPSNERHTTYL